MISKTPAYALSVIAALSVLAGCANQHQSTASSTTSATQPPAVSTAAADRTPTQAPSTLPSTGKITYRQLLKTVRAARGDAAKLEQSLLGKDLNIRINPTKSADDDFAVRRTDPVRFRCAPGESFAGGPVSARIVDVHGSADTKRALVQLNRCGATAATR